MGQSADIWQSLSETASQALIYTKFVSLSTSLRPLLAELENRVTITPDELTSLLSECHTAWVTTRHSLIGSRVGTEIGRMNPGSSDLVELVSRAKLRYHNPPITGCQTRAGCGYLKQTCLDEFNLFKHLFLSGESQL